MTDFPLQPGTETDHGTVEDLSLTAYRMTDGRWVPFTVVHPPKPVTPLVTFG